MIPITLRMFPVAAVFVAGGLSVVSAATPLPVWYGEANTTRQGYFFASNSTTPSADILENPYLAPMTTITLGSFSDGWQDPASPYDLTGVESDGAWDLGIAGNINVSCTVGAAPPPPGAYYRVDFQVYVVAYRGITALPLFNSPGFTPFDLVRTQSTVAPDPEFPGATWEGLKWTGYFDNVTTNNIGFSIRAPSNNVSVIDNMEVFTKLTLIPEPSTMLLFVLSTFGWAIRRRRP